MFVMIFSDLHIYLRACAHVWKKSKMLQNAAFYKNHVSWQFCEDAFSEGAQNWWVKTKEL